MSAIRWWLFKRLSRLGWWICPEPRRSALQQAVSFDAQIARVAMIRAEVQRVAALGKEAE